VRSASSYYVDFANTLKAPSYTLFGAKLGYEAPDKRWNVFLDARNLTDEHYVTATNTSYNLAGQDFANFYPGDGFGVTTGVAFHF
jgi:iron complex outermembrane receptor protein